jgi:predicted peroxiredoxin
MDEEKALIVMSSGPDTPRRCASPFFFATLGRAMEYEVTIFFIVDGILLLKKSLAENVLPKPGGKSAGEFLREAVDAGVKLTACTSAMELHDLTEDDLIPEVQLVGGTSLWQMAANSKIVLSF